MTVVNVELAAAGKKEPLLPPYRVLDLTDHRGDLAAYLLAQLGADVIAVEPPEGQHGRHLGPFAADQSGCEASLNHWAYSRGKRSVIVESADQLNTLALNADVLIECGAFPLDLPRLQELNPSLIIVSISAFGRSGPKAGWAATDLIVNAASGTLALTGDEDRAPIRVGVFQTWRYAAMDAACAALLALYERHHSGLGQHADISAQQSYTTATQYQSMAALVGREPSRRISGGVRVGPVIARTVFPCKDGHITLGFLTGPLFGAYADRMFSWIQEEGECDPALVEAKWTEIGLLSDDPEVLGLMENGSETIARFTSVRTKEELLQAALDRRLLIAPVMTPGDLLGLEHLAVRHWWEVVEGVTYPGLFVKSTVASMPSLGRPPKLGEHTTEILAEKVQPVADSKPAEKEKEDRLPLEGITVVDFSWVYAGPATTRILADHGAKVIRIESQRRPDTIRGATPHIGDPGNPENSLCWHSLNAGKLSFSLDITHPLAKDVVLDLARSADILVESFSPGTAERLGLGYARLSEVNPRLIMLSSSLMGQSGPMSSYAGFGMAASAIAGFYSLAGWPDRDPSGPYGAYSDYTSPRFMVAALLAALEWRRRTGKGQYLDFAQLEGAAQLIAPEILEAAVNGSEIPRCGNEDPCMAPHGVYPVDGEDQWIAIACENDDQWRALAELMSCEDLSELSAERRLVRKYQLDEVITSWTKSRDGLAVETELQARGVPAHRVCYAPEVVEDPQLKFRDHFAEVPHPIHGTSWAERSSIQLSRTPGSPKWAGPTFGQHLHEVLNDVLGYDDESVAELIAAGALE